MEFEWDEVKRRINLAKHGIDFLDARRLFDGRSVVTRESSRRQEQRWCTTGLSLGDLMTVVWTLRNDRIRIISARSARNEEKRAYRQIHG
jgi:uncharacterized protein